MILPSKSSPVGYESSGSSPPSNASQAKINYQGLSLDDLVENLGKEMALFNEGLASALSLLRSTAAARWRIGGILDAAKILVEAEKKPGAWKEWLKAHDIKSNWAWLSIGLYRRVDREEDLAGLKITEALEMVGLIKER